MTVISKLKPGQASSTIVSHKCTKVPVAEKRAPVATLADTLLVVFFEDAGYEGDTSYVYGDSGTCDSDGYGIDDMDGVQDETDGISSYQLVGDCNVSEKFSDYDFEGTSSGLIWGQNQSWVGAAWNDGGIKSFWLLHD